MYACLDDLCHQKSCIQNSCDICDLYLFENKTTENGFYCDPNVRQLMAAIYQAIDVNNNKNLIRFMNNALQWLYQKQ